MNWLLKLLIKLLQVITPLLLAKQWGKSVSEKDQLEKQVEEKTEDAKISSKPFVNSPFGRMRRKSK